MQKITVIDKATMEKVEIDSNIIKLEKGSIIQTKILRDDVAEIIQDGNNLIIKMKNDEIVTIENYFTVDAEGNNTDLVFEGTECAFLLLDWQNGIAGFKELAGLEELLPIVVGGGSAASNLLPWIVGGAVVGGAILAADGSNGSSKDQPKAPEAPSAPVVIIHPVVPDKDGITTLTGTVDHPNADVIVTLGGKDYVAKVDPTPNKDGTYNWTVDVPTSVLPPAGEEVPVKGTITDPNTGLVSPPGVDEAPVIFPPKAPVVTIDPVVPDKDGTTSITGTVDNPNADVIVTVGGKEYPVKVDPTPNEDGTYNWTVDVPTNKLPPVGEEIPAKGTVTDPNTGLVSEPSIDEIPIILPPKAPYVTIDPIVPDADRTTTLTGTVDHPDADVTVTVGGKEYPVIIDPTPNKDGTYNWMVDVPTAALPPVGQEVPVKGTVTDPNTGLVSESGTDETPIPNTGVIPAPKVEITTDINNDGVINSTELGNATDVSVKITIPKEAQVGDTLTVIINGGEPTNIIITDDMLKNGYITAVPPQANGKVDVTATITDQSGNTSGKGGDTAILDTAPPTVTVSINDDGMVTFKFNEPVKNFDLSDIVIAGGKLSNLVENADGTWSADLSGTKQGITVDISVKDKSYTDLAGNEGSSGTDKKVTVKIDSITPDGNTAIISGTTEPGNKVTVTLPDGSTLVSEPADEKGHWTVTTDKPLVDGNTVDAVTDDQDGKPTSDDVLLPFVSINVVGGDDILNEGELAELTDADGNVTITGTVSNPSASMTITFNGKVYSGDQVTVNADGTWSIKVPASDVLTNNDIKAQGHVVGADGTLIESNVAERPVGQDLTPPGVDVEITAKGEIIIQFDADVDPSSINPKDFIIIDKNGNPIKVELTPSKDGLTWTGKVPSGIDGDITVTVPENSYKDYAGNLGGQGTANQDVDTTAPSVVVDIIANAKDETSATATFTFSEDIDPKTFSSADLIVTGGRIVGEPKQNADGTWSIELKVEPGQTVKVEVKDDSYTDLEGNKGSGNDDSLITISITEVTPGTDANGKPITNITGKTEPGNEVVVTLPDGTKLPPVIADKDGNWTVTTDIPLKDGDNIDASTTNQDGKPIDDAVSLPVISIDVVAGDDVVNEQELLDLTVDGLFTITGTVSNPNADITVTFNGKEYNISAKDITPDGKWSLKVPADEVGASNSITAIAKTDIVESVPAIRNPTLDNEPPTVQVSINDKGEITIKYAPDVDPSTVDPKEIIIKDENGNRIKVELTPSEDGLTLTGKTPLGIDGTVTVTVPDQSYADKSGNLGSQGTANQDVDTTAPSVVVDIIANTKDETSATAIFTFSEDIDPKTFSSADLIVTGGRVVGEPKQNADGTWSIELKVEPGQTVKVEVKEDSYTDLEGNKGSGNDDSLITISITEVTSGTDANGKPITNITGKTEPGNEVVVTLPDGTKLPPVIADKDGNWTVTTDIPLKDGDDIDASTTNQDGKPIDDAVSLPVISIDVVAGDDVVNEQELLDLIVDGLFTITGTVSNPNADITVTFNGKEYNIPAKDITPDGKWSLKVPADEVGASNSITAIAKTDTVESVPAIRNPTLDNEPPTVQVSINDKGEITIKYAPDVDPSTVDPKEIIIKDENGNRIKVELTPSEDGLTLTGKTPLGIDGTVTVTVPDQSYADKSGNLGSQGIANTDVDTTPPQVTVKVGEDGNITLTYPDDVNPDSIITDKITVKDETGKDIPVIFEKQPDGSYTAQVPPGTDGTVKVEVPAGSYNDLTGNPGLVGKGEGPVDTTPPQVTVKVGEDGSITLTYPDDVDPDSIITDKITVKDETGKDIPVIFEKQPDGSYTAQVPPGTDGTVKVEVPAGSYDDLTGNSGLIGKGEGPVDTTPPQVIVKVGEDGNITLTYPDDVDPDSIITDKITVKDETGKDIPVIFEKQPDGSYTAQVPPGTDGTVKVEVPVGSYDDLTGNPGLIGKGEGPVDTVAPIVNPTSVITNEDQSVVLKWAHFGITDANTTNANLIVTITHLPTDGTLYYTNASGNKVAIINGQKLTYADIDSGKVTFEPDANEASNNVGDTYADVGFSVSDGKHTTDGSIEIVVDAVADKPNLGFGLVEWEPATVNLNIKTWSNLKEVTIGGKKHTLTGDGSGVSDVTLKTVFEYLTSNQATNPATSEGKTNSLSNGNVPTYNGVAIEGYVYLEAGHTYRYQGKADDSGLLIIGNNDPAYVSWGGSSTSVNKDFTVTESGFYTFDFYMHNQSGEGNYNFQLKDLGGDKISYFPDLKTAIDMMNKVYQGENSSVEWTVSDLIQKDAADKDQYGFHRPYFNLSGEVGKDISLGLLATGLNDKDGSESLSLAFEGLVEGMQIYAIAQDGTRTLLGTADANGILKFSTTDLSINGQSLVAVAPKNYIVSGASDTLDVKVTATATEQSNGSEASTEMDFDIILYPPTGVAAKALLALPMQDDDIIFNLLSDTNVGGNDLRTVDHFNVGSSAKIDLSALLSDAATLGNIGEFVTVDYDANADQAVISIDRDGTASAYQSQDLLILTHQTTDVRLNDLLKNNHIII